MTLSWSINVAANGPNLYLLKRGRGKDVSNKDPEVIMTAKRKQVSDPTQKRIQVFDVVNGTLTFNDRVSLTWRNNKAVNTSSGALVLNGS